MTSIYPTVTCNLIPHEDSRKCQNFCRISKVRVKMQSIIMRVEEQVVVMDVESITIEISTRLYVLENEVTHKPSFVWGNDIQ